MQVTTRSGIVEVGGTGRDQRPVHFAINYVDSQMSTEHDTGNAGEFVCPKSLLEFCKQLSSLFEQANALLNANYEDITANLVEDYLTLIATAQALLSQLQNSPPQAQDPASLAVFLELLGQVMQFLPRLTKPLAQPIAAAEGKRQQRNENIEAYRLLWFESLTSLLQQELSKKRKRKFPSNATICKKVVARCTEMQDNKAPDSPRIPGESTLRDYFKKIHAEVKSKYKANFC